MVGGFRIGSGERRLIALGPLGYLVDEPEHVHLVEGRVLHLHAVGVDRVYEHLPQAFERERPPAARPRHVREVIRQQQQRRPLVEAVVVIGLEVLRFGEEGTQLPQRTSEARFEISGQRVRDLQLHVEVDQLHRPVSGGVVVVERDRVHGPCLVVGHIGAQDRDQLFQIRGAVSRLPLVQQRRLGTQAVEVELPIGFVVGVLCPGERPLQIWQRISPGRPHVAEQVLSGGFFALVHFGVHALLAQRQRRGVAGHVVHVDRHLRAHRAARARTPQLHGHGVRPV